ncbi:MAG: hypothetical protein J6Z11_13080, partial [Candidatus Riflebacteria bacterium]|nr:hypothetical protein [Candidatus Riflebacteria bacterium]
MAELKKKGKEEPPKKVDDKKPKTDSNASKQKAPDTKSKPLPSSTPEKKNRLTDLLSLLGILACVGLAVLIFTDKIPKKFSSFQSYFSYFYIIGLIGILGVLGEKYAIGFLGFTLPIFMAGATVLIKLKPTQFPIDQWWDQYSVMVLFSAGFLLYLYIRFDNLKKNGVVAADTTGKITGSDGNLKARVDPALAAKYKADMEARNKKDASALDSALGIKKDGNREVGVPGVAKAKDNKDNNASEEAEESEEPVETNEERMEREVRQMREDFNKKSMRLTTTLMRIKNLTKSLDRDQIFANTVEIITKGLDAKKVQLLLNDEKEGKLRIVKATGMKVNEYKDFEVPYEENSMITHLLQIKINEVTGGAGAFGVKECEIDPQMKGLIGKGVLKTVLAAPIYAEGKLFAILNVEEMNNPDYTRDDQNLLTTCADVAGLVMKNAKLYSATMEDLVSAQKLSEDQLKQNEQ